MDYKEKYEQALEVAKETYNKQPMYKDWLESMFPELKESEDERIRKGLIKAVSRTFEGNKLFGTDVTREEALAWLEKQGEKKPQRMISAEAKEAMYGNPAWSEEDKDVINHLLAICNGAKKFIQFESCSREDIIKCQDWLTSLKERI